jgi:hypothetical protein
VPTSIEVDVEDFDVIFEVILAWPPRGPGIIST